MAILYFLIPLSIGLSTIGLLASLWALKTGQFDDLEGDQSRFLVAEEE
jgi:cbb3-type cytochrome oxidase maturation protein